VKTLFVNVLSINNGFKTLIKRYVCYFERSGLREAVSTPDEVNLNNISGF